MFDHVSAIIFTGHHHKSSSANNCPRPKVYSDTLVRSKERKRDRVTLTRHTNDRLQNRYEAHLRLTAEPLLVVPGTASSLPTCDVSGRAAIIIAHSPNHRIAGIN